MAKEEGGGNDLNDVDNCGTSSSMASRVAPANRDIVIIHDFSSSKSCGLNVVAVIFVPQRRLDAGRLRKSISARVPTNRISLALYDNSLYYEAGIRI